MMAQPGVWQSQLLVLTLKCFSTLSKTLIPLALVEKHHSNSSDINFDIAEETYSLSHENAFFVVLLSSIVYNWFNNKPPGNFLGAIAILFQVYPSHPLQFSLLVNIDW
jgi:hypothetical protein